jgi:hypothetical protein
LGVGNDPVYVKSRCFETFPFPAASSAQQARITALAEELDAHRKKVLADHADLTLTGLYNVLEKLKAGSVLNAKEKSIHERGLVAVLHSLHDELDAAVLDAYGWGDLALRKAQGEGTDEVLLERLVALNAERAREEAAGTVRWLRPEFQNPGAAAPSPLNPASASRERSVGSEGSGVSEDSGPRKAGDNERASPPAKTKGTVRQAWPAELPAQVAAVARVLTESAAPLNEEAIAAHFTGRGKWKARLPQILDTLTILGRARVVEGGWMG